MNRSDFVRGHTYSRLEPHDLGALVGHPVEARNHDVAGVDSLHQGIDRVVGSVCRDRVDVGRYFERLIEVVDRFFTAADFCRDRSGTH